MSGFGRASALSFRVRNLAELGELWSTEGGDLWGVPQTRAGFDAGRGIIPTPTTNLKTEVERPVIKALRLG